MLKKEVKAIFEKSRKWGWVLEPDAQKILSLYGFKTPKFGVAATEGEAVAAARKIGYPVVAKIVSPAVVHKSDVKGVVVGIKDDETLVRTLARLSKIDGFAGMLIAEMVKGLELIVGAKNDFQFGPMILLGMGGVGVEIYKDVSLRMAPLKTRDADHMIQELAARKLLTGYRGSEPVNLNALKKTIVAFSHLMMDMRDVVESVDLNPVMCTAKSCIVADARIMLKK
ncbi:MAG: acetate--CoA ligase family protein [Smithellaceae bacterium]|jgi:acyl-CoA synthetase (NDP forming)|nr:acetate--CoA ligase family protein [Smithellaceae bacterium]MDD3259491.1 acetate--CoA ligase family protein [Smithellaceae bacterium]MDD3849587.1 acetate--CoA ligase family protein [Smithellaceae bacterium]